MKNWKRIAAGLLAALMIAGCGSVDEAIGTVNAVADAVDEVTGYGSTEDAAAEEAVATRPEENADALDPDFTVDAAEENANDGTLLEEADPASEDAAAQDAAATGDEAAALDEDGYYYDKDSVALYLVTYHKLPSNYMTKKEAQALGWEGGALDPYAPDMAIGGDHFGNYEGLLPEDADYHECDIDTHGTKRGAKRIIYSDDWAIYYTEDHYETFEQLY